MIRHLASAMIVALALTSGAAADPVTQDPAKVPAGDYVLDKRHASLLVKVPHLGGFSRYTMRFDRLDGRFTFNQRNWQYCFIYLQNNRQFQCKINSYGCKWL